jgi:DNA-binding MarR family transcriptional regulator
MSETKDERAESVAETIRQTKPFRSAGQEGVIALLLAAEAVRWPYRELLAAHGRLTLPQYNVLRILRGAGPAGLPTLEIADRLIERTPGISRMIDRLEAKGLVERNRSSRDRRLVHCAISKKGRTLLAELDEPVDALDERAMSTLSEPETRKLISLLNRVRADRG